MDEVINPGENTVSSGSAVVTTYTYDDIDQLLSESRTGCLCSYTYDANGNRATRTLNSVTEVYTNDSGDKLIEIKIGGVTVKAFAYDDAGRDNRHYLQCGDNSFENIEPLPHDEHVRRHIENGDFKRWGGRRYH